MGDAPHVVGQGLVGAPVQPFALGVDVLPLGAAFALDAQEGPGILVHKGADLYRTVGADQLVIGADDRPCGVARTRQALAEHAVLVLPKPVGDVLVMAAEDEHFPAVVDLSDGPDGGLMAVEEALHVHVVSAAVVEVALTVLHQQQVADLACVQQFLRLAEGAAEAPHVVEGELHPVLLADAGHALAAAPGGGHRLLAVDGLHPRLGAVHRHLLVQVHPRADADDVEVLLLEHLMVVEVSPGHAELLGKAVGPLLHQVAAGNDLALVAQRLITGRMAVRHRIALDAALDAFITTADKPHAKGHLPSPPVPAARTVWRTGRVGRRPIH